MLVASPSVLVRMAKRGAMPKSRRPPDSSRSGEAGRVLPLLPSGGFPVDRGESPHKIDVSFYVAEIERVLRTENDPLKRAEVLAIVRRWQFDDMLDPISRAKARALVREFD
jgi:hypothetical protein